MIFFFWLLRTANTTWFLNIYPQQNLWFLGNQELPSRNLNNRPLSSSKNPYFHNEAKCTTFLVKMSFICMRMKNHFHIKGWALNLVLIQRPRGTRKWPPIAWRSNSQFVPKKFISGSCSTVYKLQRLTTFISIDLMIFLSSLSAFRLVTAKSMVLVDQWKKVSHSNLVSLREVFTTKAFGDNCK